MNKSPSLELLKAEAEGSLSKGAKHAVLRHLCPWQSDSVLLKEIPATGNFYNLQSLGMLSPSGLWSASSRAGIAVEQSTAERVMFIVL